MSMDGALVGHRRPLGRSLRPAHQMWCCGLVSVIIHRPAAARWPGIAEAPVLTIDPAQLARAVRWQASTRWMYPAPGGGHRRGNGGVMP